MRAHRAACWSALLLCGCAQVSRPPAPVSGVQPPAPAQAYEIVQGRGPDVVARLRAAPPLAQPEIADGATPDGDENLLRAQGLVKIGVGRYPSSDVAWLRDEVAKQARKAGADRALIYPPQALGAPALANFFVRLHLPFGANFRDLTDLERQTLGSDGVEIGEVVGGTPASEANLREGDFVVAFNKLPVRDKAQFQDLLQAHMGKRVTLTIRRNGTTMKRLVVLGTLAPAA
ncbi:MAG: PDZ domain-containing protein [Xanthomonadales bacterium PRO7]|nr:PDZ domain-containing protein [Xanthomonadales bacterium PRO7]